LKITFIKATLISLLAVTATVLNAEQETKGACKPDYEKYCKDTKIGQGRVWRCLAQHEDQLSPECKANVHAAREKMKEFRKDCGSDVKTYCKDVKGGGKVIACLRTNSDKVSPACQTHLKKPADKDSPTPSGAE